MVFYYPDDITVPALAVDINTTHTLASGDTFHIARIDEVNHLMNKIRVVKSLRIYGKSGMGKSTILPKLIAHSQRRTVITILPDDDSAFRAYNNYVNRPDRGLRLPTIPSAYIEGDNFKFGSAQLVWTSHRALTSWLFANRFTTDYNDMLKDKIVIIDQAEDSRYNTRVLDSIIAPLRPAKLLSITSVVSLMATTKVEPEPIDTFPASRTPDTWDIAQDDGPWSLIHDKPVTLIYTDNHIITRQLRGKYEDAGVETRSLTTTSTESQYLDIVKEIDLVMAHDHDTCTRLVIFIDDSYRTGYYFGVPTIIDITSYEEIHPSDVPRRYVDAAKDDKDVFLLSGFEPSPTITNIHDRLAGTLPPEAYRESISNILYILATADRNVTLPAEYWVCAARRSMNPDVTYLNQMGRTTHGEVNARDGLLLASIYDFFYGHRSFQYLRRPDPNPINREISTCISRYNLLGIEMSAMRRAVIDNYYRRRDGDGMNITRLKFVPALVKVSNLMSLERYILRRFLESDGRVKKFIRYIPTANGRVDKKVSRYRWLLIGRCNVAILDPECGIPRFFVRDTPIPDPEDHPHEPLTDSDDDSVPSWASDTSSHYDTDYVSSSSYDLKES